MNAQQTSTTILARVVIASTLLTVLVFLAGCSGAGTPMTKVEEPEPPPLPTLIGTWQYVHTYTNDDGEMETETDTLTFTKSRFIQFTIQEESEGFSFWATSGTWTSTDTTVTKIYHPWVREEGTDNFVRSEEPFEVVKEYLWGDAERDTLLVHYWGARAPVNSFDRYTRVEGPDPDGMVGTWVHRGRWEDDERGTAVQTLTYSITADTFTETDRNEYENGEVEVTTLSGNLTIDEDNQFLKVAVTSARREWNGEPAEDFPSGEFEGHELRYGYAEAGNPDKLSFSRWEDEQDWNDETMMYVDDEETPYGYYQRLFTRQQADVDA